MRVGRVVCLVVVAALFAAMPAASHAGYGGGTIDARGILEGEAYDTSATAGCDPTGDSEHTEVRLSSDTSRGAYAFIPHNGCYVTFQAVSFPRVGYFEEFTMSASGSASVLSFRTDVYVDGVLSSSATYSVTGGSPWQRVNLDPISVIPVGTHEVRVQNTIVSGAAWHNFNLDCLKFDPPDDKPCLIREPLAAFEAEGGCMGEERTFTDQSTAPSGTTFVRSTWEFGDGTTFVADPWAPSVTHTYTAPGSYTVRLTVEDSAGGIASATQGIRIIDCTPRPTPLPPPSGIEPPWYYWPPIPYAPAGPPTVSLQDPLSQAWLDTDGDGAAAGTGQDDRTGDELCVLPPCAPSCACVDDVSEGERSSRGDRTLASPLAREVASVAPPAESSTAAHGGVLWASGIGVVLTMLLLGRRRRA